MTERLTLAQRIINWIWYTDIQIEDDGRVTVLANYRLHSVKHTDHPKVHGTLVRAHELGDRTLIGLEWNRYDPPAKIHSIVANPQHVFSYGEPKQPTTEPDQ